MAAVQWMVVWMAKDLKVGSLRSVVVPSADWSSRSVRMLGGGQRARQMRDLSEEGGEGDEDEDDSDDSGWRDMLPMDVVTRASARDRGPESLYTLFE